MSPTHESAAVESAQALGLSRLEAEVYVHLLAEEPATAYAVGRAIGRPTANVYKAVERLARLGAVLVEEGTNRLCRAVPASEFIRHAKDEFSGKADQAEKALSRLEKQTYDERVYRVESVAEVFARAREMLEQAAEIAVVDAFPGALDALAPAIAATCKRGVRTYVEAYRDITIPGARIVVVPGGEKSLQAWKSEQLNLVVDGREHLLALLDAGLQRVHQAVWSRSVYLSCILHAGRMSELALIEQMIAAKGDRKRTAALSKHFFRNSSVPGHHELMRRYASDPK